MNTIHRLLATALGPVVALLAISVASFVNQGTLNQAHVNRLESYRLAQELRASSDELTRLARTYVLTGDPAYERDYWHVLAVRNGEAAREDGRTVPLRTLMERQGFTAGEFDRLKVSEDNSNALVTTEEIAMHAMKGEFADGRGGYTRRGPVDVEMARRIMHDRKYHDDKATIMGPIAEFERMLDRRTEATMLRYRRRGDLLQALGVAVAALALVAAWLGIRRHAASLRSAMGELSDASENVAHGAAEVASASRSLAQGATEQVAALEEISASARDLAAGAVDNLKRADAAADLVDHERREFASASGLLGEMASAMDEIASAGGRISKINKLVDEIAFQTNILALNAAVEAARAGAAGQGFAVVADEVRSLAQRCAAAAAEAARLIEESIGRTRVGKEKMGQVTESIRVLGEVVNEVGGLMGQVRDGSRTQRDAVTRIGTAIGQIEQVTHRSAAGAEEGSVAAESMADQADTLSRVVAELEAMVGADRGPERDPGVGS